MIPFIVLVTCLTQSFVDRSDPLLQADCAMTWVSDRWSGDHVRTVFAVDRGEVEPLISVDGWLSGLDFDGFTDVAFKPAIVLTDGMTMISTMVPHCCWLDVVAGVVFCSGC